MLPQGKGPAGAPIRGAQAPRREPKETPNVARPEVDDVKHTQPFQDPGVHEMPNGFKVKTN